MSVARAVAIGAGVGLCLPAMLLSVWFLLSEWRPLLDVPGMLFFWGLPTAPMGLLMGALLGGMLQRVAGRPDISRGQRAFLSVVLGALLGLMAAGCSITLFSLPIGDLPAGEWLRGVLSVWQSLFVHAIITGSCTGGIIGLCIGSAEQVR